MSTVRRFVVVVSLFIALIGAYFFVTPYLAVHGLKVAIRDRDGAELEERVDFPALRENLKGQINVLMFKSAERDDLKDNPFGAIALGLASKLTDSVIESLVTASGLAALAQGTVPSETDSVQAIHSDKLFANAKLTHDSLKRFSLWVPDKHGGELQFVFRCQGLTWRLSSIFLPSPTNPAAPPAEAIPAEALPAALASPASPVAVGERIMLPSGVKVTHSVIGTGPSPASTDQVTLHFHGTLPDGTVVMSSVDRGEPVTFPLNRVIPCWTEGVQTMKVGGRALLVCPPTTAFGDRGAPPHIPPNATLEFVIELIKVN